MSQTMTEKCGKMSQTMTEKCGKMSQEGMNYD